MALNGIDISNWQAGIDLPSVPADFVICKATEGVTFVDPYCDGFMQKAMNIGHKVGVYHFASGGDAVAEADFFVDNVQGYVGKAILVLDWEADALRQGPGWAKTWLDRVTERTGVRPLLYTSKSVCREYDWFAVVVGDYGLWMAQYPDYSETGYQSDPWTDQYGVGAFSGWVMHQYTSTGRLNGYNGNLDLNIFYGDAAAWDAYATGGGKVTTGDQKTTETPKKKSVNKLAQEVLNGKWGDGEERKRRLTDAGYSYDKVQQRVNELLGQGTKSVNKLAREVVAGKWGNGQDRKNALTAAGYDYDAVQRRVNEILSK